MYFFCNFNSVFSFPFFSIYFHTFSYQSMISFPFSFSFSIHTQIRHQFSFFSIFYSRYDPNQSLLPKGSRTHSFPCIVFMFAYLACSTQSSCFHIFHLHSPIFTFISFNFYSRYDPNQSRLKSINQYRWADARLLQGMQTELLLRGMGRSLRKTTPPAFQSEW